MKEDERSSKIKNILLPWQHSRFEPSLIIISFSTLKIVFFLYYLVVDCTLRTACNFEVDLQYWGDLSDIVEVPMHRMLFTVCQYLFPFQR